MKIKQSTATVLKIGPFVDEDNGKTAETLLSIGQSDIRLAKNGAAWAQRNAAGTLTHEEAGWYELDLDTTDTDTLGELVVAVHKAGALPVWVRLQVVPSAVYDATVSGTGNGVRADVQAIVAGGITAASIASDAITAAKIAANAITSAKLADGVMTAAKFADDAISAASVAAAAANKLADHVWRRTYENIRASANGDTVSFRSPLGALAKLVNKIVIAASTLTVYHEDDATEAGTQTAAGTPGATPITSLDTD